MFKIEQITVLRSAEMAKEQTPMNAVGIKVLLIESDPCYTDQIRSVLSNSHNDSFAVEWVGELSEALDRLNAESFAVILLNLFLPDSHGIDSFDKLFTAVPKIPILILSQDSEETTAMEAVAHGARDYLLPRHLDNYSLPRALRHAIQSESLEEELFVERDRALVTLNSIGDAVLCTDISGNITYLNVVAEKLTGWTQQEAIGQQLTEVFRIIDGVTRQASQNPLAMAVAENRTVGLTINCVLIRRDGTEHAIEDSAAPIHDRVGSTIGAVIVFHDVGVARAMAEEMTHAAQHDLVTGLPNRLLLNDRIDRAIASANRNRRLVAVMFLDLDRFKNVNDTLGHTIGDKLLQSVAKRLRLALRTSDTVSRQGGDEFIILLPDIADSDHVAQSAERVLETLRDPHVIEQQLVSIRGSIGISIYPEDGDNSGQLLENADKAMYHAKESGRNHFQFFRGDMNQQAEERQCLETRLKAALERKEFVLLYQPKISLDTGKVTGCEALIRWRRSRSQLISATGFLSVAKDTGLIVPIGQWVVREACLQASAWRRAGLPVVPIAVNISAIEFKHKDFVASLRTILEETTLEARSLELEFTEESLMQDAESANCTLRELKRLGIRVTVDNFGAGDSNLSSLRQFPIDILKIAPRYIQQITANPEDSILLNTMIHMGKSLKHVVVAGGIETREQKTFLKNHDCPEGQGFLFSQPLAAKQFAHLLRHAVM